MSPLPRRPLSRCAPRRARRALARSGVLLGWAAIAGGLSAGLFGVACASSSEAPPTTAPPPDAPLRAHHLLPLEHDTVFSYETSTDTGLEGLMVLQIRRPRPDLAELDVAGRVQRLDLAPTGILHASGGYVLKDPIEKDASFPGAFGEVRITEVGKQVKVPAGTFEGCVVTVEESSQPFKRARSTYCPGVGLVAFVVEGSGEADVSRVETRLKSHGPRVSFR